MCVCVPPYKAAGGQRGAGAATPWWQRPATAPEVPPSQTLMLTEEPSSAGSLSPDIWSSFNPPGTGGTFSHVVPVASRHVAEKHGGLKCGDLCSSCALSLLTGSLALGGTPPPINRKPDHISRPWQPLTLSADNWATTRGPHHTHSFDLHPHQRQGEDGFMQEAVRVQD